MKVLVISPVFPPMRIGEAEHTYFVCQHLASRGLEVHLLTSMGVTLADSPFAIHPVMKLWSWREAPRIAHYIRRLSPDAILLIYLGKIYNNEPMISFVPTLVRQLRPSVRFVTQFEHLLGTRVHLCTQRTRTLQRIAVAWAGSGADREYGTLLRDSHRTIFLSASHLAQLSSRQQGLADKSLVVPPPPILRMAPDDPDRRLAIRQSIGVESHHFLFAYFGFLYPWRGVETLLKAFRSVVTTRPEARLVLVGGIVEEPVTIEQTTYTSYADYLKSLVRDLGIGGTVRFTGTYSSESDIGSAYLRAADACVLPNETGIYLNNSSLGAAFAHALPVVATQGSAIDDPLADRQNLLFCPPKSPDPMAAAMIQIVDDPSLRRTLQAGARVVARDWYDWERATARTVAALGLEQ